MSCSERVELVMAMGAIRKLPSLIRLWHAVEQQHDRHETTFVDQLLRWMEKRYLRNDAAVPEKRQQTILLIIILPGIAKRRQHQNILFQFEYHTPER
jgi:hypothetical protein